MRREMEKFDTMTKTLQDGMTEAHYGGRTIAYLAPVKLLLILAVVMIHSNVSVPSSSRGTLGGEIVSFLFSQTCAVAVPLFFIISGYLFFLGVKRFDEKVYKRKILNRLHTLLIPYLSWNLICAIIFYVKVKFLGYDGLGLFEDGHIIWPKYLYGFISIERVGMPFAMAFWFIRNLIVFVVLSPVFYFIARRTWLLLLFFALNCVSTVNIYYSELFLFGAALSIRDIRLDFARGKVAVVLSLVIFVLSTIAIQPLMQSQLNKPLFLMQQISGLVLIVNFAKGTDRYFRKGVGLLLCNATFFIYSVHQCFSSVVKRVWLGIFGDETLPEVVASMVMTFGSLLVISVIIYMVMLRLTPRLLSVLTGGRGMNLKFNNKSA